MAHEVPTSSSMGVALRPATPADVPLLLMWDQQPHVIAGTDDDPDHDGDSRDWIGEWFPPLPGFLHVLIASVNGQPIGVMEVIDPAADMTQYWGPMPPGLRALDIWIGDPSSLGRGYGTAMMQQAAALCFADPSVNALLLDPLESNIRAHRFYERLGFVEVERRTFGEGDRCVVYRLDREIWAGTLPVPT